MATSRARKAVASSRTPRVARAAKAALGTPARNALPSPTAIRAMPRTSPPTMRTAAASTPTAAKVTTAARVARVPAAIVRAAIVRAVIARRATVDRVRGVATAARAVAGGIGVAKAAIAPPP